MSDEKKDDQASSGATQHKPQASPSSNDSGKTRSTLEKIGSSIGSSIKGKIERNMQKREDSAKQFATSVFSKVHNPLVSAKNTLEKLSPDFFIGHLEDKELLKELMSHIRDNNPKIKMLHEARIAASTAIFASAPIVALGIAVIIANPAAGVIIAAIGVIIGLVSVLASKFIHKEYQKCMESELSDLLGKEQAKSVFTGKGKIEDPEAIRNALKATKKIEASIKSKFPQSSSIQSPKKLFEGDNRDKEHANEFIRTLYAAEKSGGLVNNKLEKIKGDISTHFESSTLEVESEEGQSLLKDLRDHIGQEDSTEQQSTMKKVMKGTKLEHKVDVSFEDADTDHKKPEFQTPKGPDDLSAGPQQAAL